MNKKTFSKSILFFIGLLLFFSIIPTQAYAGTTTTLYELFSNETAGTNPVSTIGEIPYTYAEDEFTYANVNASHFYYINQSSTATTNQGYGNFTFNNTYAADSLSFYFKYNNYKSGGSYRFYNQSGTKFIISGASTILNISVYGQAASAVKRDLILIKDSTGTIVYNQTGGGYNWHKVTLTFVWTNNFNPDRHYNTIYITVTNITSGISHTATANIPITETYIHEFQVENTPYNAKVNMQIDTISLTYTTPNYASYPSVEQTIVIIAVPILLGVAMALMLISGTVTKETMVAFIVIFFMYVITLSFLFS